MESVLVLSSSIISSFTGSSAVRVSTGGFKVTKFEVMKNDIVKLILD